MTEFFLGAITGACAWLLYFAGRWLYRNVYLQHPTYGEADRYARRYLIKPSKLWPKTPLTLAEMEQRRAARAMSPLTTEEVEEALGIPRTDAGPFLILNVRDSPELPSVSLTAGPIPGFMTWPPKTEEYTKSIVPPGPATSSENTVGPGDQWSRTTP